MYATNNFNKLCRKEKKGSLRIDRKSHIYRLVECIWQEQKRKKTILCCQVHIPSDCNRLSSSLQSNCCIWIRNIGFLVHSFINMKIRFFGMLLGTGVFWSTRQVSIDRFAYLSTAISYVSLLHTILYDVIPKKNQIDVATQKNSTIMIVSRRTWILLLFNSIQLNSTQLTEMSCLNEGGWRGAWDANAAQHRSRNDSENSNVIREEKEQQQQQWFVQTCAIAVAARCAISACVLSRFLHFSIAAMLRLWHSLHICFSMKMKTGSVA